MKRILVTGSNKGIGLAIVEALLTEHSDVTAILCARNKSRGDAACKSLCEKNPSWNTRLENIELDVCSDESVRLAVEHVRQKGKLYAIVNNAGILSGDVSDVLNTNYYGIKRVTQQFIGLLDPSIGRIVNIGSGAAPNFIATLSPEKKSILVDSKVTEAAIEKFIDDFVTTLKTEGFAALEAKGFGKGDVSFHPYGMTKAAVAAYTLLTAHQHPHLKVNVCTPGLIATDIFEDAAKSASTTKEAFAASMGALPPSQGTKSAMQLLFGNVGTGHYYGSDAKRSPMGKYRAPGSAEYDGSDGN